MCHQTIIRLICWPRSLVRVNNTPNTHSNSSSTRLRVALVTETFAPEVNGVAMTLGKLVTGMQAKGHRVQVIRPNQVDEAAKTTWDRDELLVRGLPIPGYGDMRFGFPSGHRLRKAWQACRPDVVHVATEGPLGWSAVATARAMGLPLTSSFHTNFDSYSQHYRLGLLKTVIDSYLRYLHNRTQATLVPTQAMLQTLQTRGYNNLGLMPRGVALAQFSPARQSEELRTRWGVGPMDLVVMHVGRLAKEKNVGTLLAAFAAIQHQHPKAKLLLVGDGPLRAALGASCPSAIFTGNLSGVELAQAYASGDLFLFPSLTETYGNVVPEALASGLAVVSYNRASAAQIITHQRHGVLVPEPQVRPGDSASSPGNDPRFIAAAAALANDPLRLHAIRQNAPASVAHLAWSNVIEAFETTLRGVIERSNKLSGRRPHERLAHAQP
jgi:glycosyltransferase involved in cell wall biosynthesis